MTAKILKSLADQIEDFPAKAAAHAVEMKNWRAHMERVKADEANPSIDPVEKHWPLKQPSSHPLVETAVNENDDIDYKIVDDSPTPEQVLRAKKDKLIINVAVAEDAAIAALVPPGRLRIFAIREAKIRERDNAVMSDIVGPATVVKTIKSVVGLGPKLEDVQAEAARRRPAADTTHLEQQEQRRAAIDKIRTQGAIAHDAIEDLTLDNIDSYKIPDFTTKD